MEYDFEPLSGKIIERAITVHKALGPGFLESIYHGGLKTSNENIFLSGPVRPSVSLKLLLNRRPANANRLCDGSPIRPAINHSLRSKVTTAGRPRSCCEMVIICQPAATSFWIEPRNRSVPKIPASYLNHKQTNEMRGEFFVPEVIVIT